MHACAARSHFIKMCIVECRMSPGMAMGLQLVGYVNKCVCVCVYACESITCLCQSVGADTAASSNINCVSLLFRDGTGVRN